MSKKLKKFKNEFLQDISNKTDNLKDEIKQEIGIKSIKQDNIKIQNKKIKPVMWGSLVTAFTFILIIAVVITINLFNNHHSDFSHYVPIYKGMTAEKIDDSRRNLSGNLGDELISDIGVVTTPGVSFFEKTNTKFIIKVEIENPKSFEILSFTLNNKKYQSYEFKEGSTSTLILVEFTTNETPGIEEITIDAIKYVGNDNTISDAEFNGNKTIKVGVTYQNTPTSTVLENINLNNIYLDINVTDEDEIINVKNGLAIYLFENTNLVKKNNLNIGKNDIYFNNLKYDTTYTYIVIATFDLLDGNGRMGNILAENTVTIISPYNNKKVETDSTSCTIELAKVDNFNGNITKLELFKNNDKVSDLSLTSISGDIISVDNLLSNTEYRVVITYEYLLNNEKIIASYKVDIKTKAKDIPTLEITVDEITSSMIKFKYNVLEDSSVNITSIKLLKEEEVIDTLTDLTNLSFTNLLSDNDYIISINYTYDLNDGNPMIACYLILLKILMDIYMK